MGRPRRKLVHLCPRPRFPPQLFHVLPSTTVSEAWLPIPLGCAGDLADVPDCGLRRGVQPFQNSPSRGFQTNASTTWDQLGIYQRQDDWDVLENSPALCGLETLTLSVAGASNIPLPDVSNITLDHQIVAGVTAADVWLGLFPLSPRAARFNVRSDSVPSLLDSLSTQNRTASRSFAYTAGASYESPPSPGSLTLGGYDAARMQTPDTSSATGFPLDGDDEPTIPLRIQSIVAENLPGALTLALLPDAQPVTAHLDSTVAPLWLPTAVCDLFQYAFGLTYNASTELYAVNDTMRQTLLDQDTALTLAVSGLADSTATVRIRLPYAALDAALDIPSSPSPTHFFPLKRAVDSKQHLLGRTFLQEAYLIVDWDRRNFTLAPVAHASSTTVSALTAIPSYRPPTPSSALSTPTIIGIALGTALALALILFSARLLRQHLRRPPPLAPLSAAHRWADKDPELPSPQPSEAGDMHVHAVAELSADSERPHEAGGNEVLEIDGRRVECKDRGNGDVVALP